MVDLSNVVDMADPRAMRIARDFQAKTQAVQGSVAAWNQGSNALDYADEDDEAAVEPATRPAPSPNGECNADAARRTTTPQTAAGPDQPAAHGNGRTKPRPPVGG